MVQFMDKWEKLGAIVGGIWGAISSLFFISASFTSAFAELEGPIFTIEEKFLLSLLVSYCYDAIPAGIS